MSKLEVNEISKTATGDNITISSEMILQDTVQTQRSKLNFYFCI